ncbi:hypothetical protein CBR_g18942 [Chara braunii]|uniref:BSD domain-containing protein n=1 Tax=Chara braunii TaxID=69332 RepID=A0A388KX26_CHABU|nr:hypothetical protein CBR_g18942 [Chara braunii]|eukprot:GBG74532.1 hypothetical protein CBR_g18942 [Chara braunii]
MHFLMPVEGLMHEVVDGEEELEPSSGWGFADVIKTLALKSEEVISTYQRDLQEFGFGLKKETETVVDATTNVIADLPQQLAVGGPSSQRRRTEGTETDEDPGGVDDRQPVHNTLEVAAKTAGEVVEVLEESLETVGQTIEDIGSSVWKGTAEIFAQVREAVAQVEEEAGKNSKLGRSTSTTNFATSAITRGYRGAIYGAGQVSGMQRDSGTYCDEPDDAEDYSAWKSTFRLVDKKGDIDALLKENAFMQELQSRIVPLIVEYDTFWTRYFYRLHKLQQAEDARADLVKRATTNDEEELSWDVDDAETPKESRPAQASTSQSSVAVLPAESVVSEHDESGTLTNDGGGDHQDGGHFKQSSGELVQSESRPVSVEKDMNKVQGAASEHVAVGSGLEGARETAVAQTAKPEAANVSPRGAPHGQDVPEEVDSKSEASGGSAESDWLVVDDKSEGKAPSDKAGSPSCAMASAGKVGGGGATAERGPETAKLAIKKVDEPQLEEVDELAMEELEIDDDKLKQMVDSGKYAGLAKAAATDPKPDKKGSGNNDDQEEDWGEWE